MIPEAKDAYGYFELAVAAGVCALYASWQFFRLLRRDRFAADTPVAKIRSAAQGYVHLEGRVHPSAEHGEVRSPLTHRPCVWWDYKVEHYQAGRIRGTEWSCLESGTSVSPFVLRDADGECLVGPVGAEIIPSAHNVWHGRTPRPEGPPSSGIPVMTVFDDRTYRYTEGILAADARVTVLGELRSRSVVTELDEEVRAIVTEWKKDQPGLLARFDQDHDGELNMAEWDAVRDAARAEAQGKIGGAQSRLSVVGETTHGEPFLIAPLDGRQLVKREKHRATLAFCAAVLLAAVAAVLTQRAVSAYEASAAAPAGFAARPGAS